MKRPRVMHIIGCLAPYGSERSMLNVCLSLRDRYEPIVLAFGGGTLARTLADEGIQFETMSSAETEEGSLWRRFEFCRNRIRRYQPDLVHTHYAYSNVLGRLAAHMQGIPTVGHIRGPERLSGTLLYRTAYRVAHHGRTRLVAVSRGLADVVKPPRDCALLPSTMPSMRHSSSQRTASPPTSTESWGSTTVRTSSGPSGASNQERTTLRYYVVHRRSAEPRQTCISYALEMVDNGRTWSGLEMRWGSLGGYISSGIGMTSARFAAPGRLHKRHLPRAAAWCWKQWGRAASRWHTGSGTEETIIDGQQGFLVPAGDDEAMAERILQLYRDPQLREQMGQQAYERVRDKFSLDALARSIDALYRELLGMP